ncbi:hypothetical protein [Pseudochryseolinea flava]|uniref:DUF4221 domain-containing protein n=1 Tax=Pseudochryseolinea flava TaxID=2059302 RepID=A0A364XWP9_9BACT|nr:hypothetical protein [Pseudochryseolinea flava]RAV98601.1 hypothetical protein DQQ10_22980 [Pseudochryseolinea flava]
MKAIKGLILFASIVISISSCFDPPEFSTVPQISLNSITFTESLSSEVQDSIVIDLSFRDGDGDLGLNDSDTVPPYQTYQAYVADNGVIKPILVPKLFPTRTDLLVLDFGNTTGRLVMSDLASHPQYTNVLPPFDPSSNCNRYMLIGSDRRLMKLLVRMGDIDRVPDEFHLKDTTIGPTSYKLLKGNLYFTRNKYVNNYHVRILEQVATNKFEEIFLSSENNEICYSPFDGRFPVLKDDTNSPLEGDLSYSLKSFGLLTVLSPRLFKFEISIVDRALNQSNVIETKVYTLDELRP